MTAWEAYAIIKDNTVQNIIVGDYYSCNNVATANYGNGSIAIEITQIPTEIGDKYEDGVFKHYNKDSHEYEVIQPLPTDKQQIDALVAENTVLNELVTDIQIALVELAEEL